MFQISQMYIIVTVKRIIVGLALTVISPLTVAIVVVPAWLIATPSIADDDDKHRHDHYVARKAMMRGEILKLELVLAQVRKQVSGEFIDVELERRGKLWIYKIKVIMPDGSLIKVIVNAQTGKVGGPKRNNKKRKHRH